MSERQKPKNKHSRLTEHQVMELENTINEDDFALLVELLKSYPINYKSLSQVRGVVSSMNTTIAHRWGLDLIDIDIVHKITGCILLERAKIWKIDVEKTRGTIIDFALKDDWRIRKAAIDLLKKAIINSYKTYQDIIITFIESDNPFYRRVAISVAKEISTLSEKHNNLKKKLLHLIKDIIYEQNPYVMTVAKDAFANGFLRYFPEETNNWVHSISDELMNEQAISAVLSFYSTPTVLENLDPALKLMEKFLNNESEIVKYARSSVFRQIAKYLPEKLSFWLEARLDNQQIVDHWAELETEGLISIDLY
ncbi:MAG: hypothetical protein ACXAD7_01780 [Candidatus Kariarchaeaceae archaeon]|jgi:3-methyladenine DNA glycosylase AlkD